MFYRFVRVSHWATLGLFFLGAPIFALDPFQRLTQYAHSTWSRENGQLPASISALTQTPDGTLWIGTDSGLQQFDGVRFQTWTPPGGQPIASDYVTALAAGPEGGLWIGTREGLSYWRDSRVRNYQTRTGPSGPAVTDILVDTTGIVWVATAGFHIGDLCRLEGDALRCGTVGTLPERFVTALYQDRRGKLWAGGSGLCHWNTGARLVCPVQVPEPIHAIAEDPQGEIWVAGKTLTRLTADGLIAPPVMAAYPDLKIKALLSDRDGGLWIGTHGQGLMRLYQGKMERYRHDDGLSSDYVRGLLEDREGNIWVGSDGGLDRFRDYAVTRISKREGLPESSVNSVLAAKDGTVWFGSSAGLVRFTDGGSRGYSKRDGLPHDVVLGTFQEQAGRLWAFTLSGLAYSEGSRFHSLRLPSGQEMMVRAATETADHAVWMSDLRHGLIRMLDARIAEMKPWSDFGMKQAWALEADPVDGGLWLGFAEGGVAYYKSGQPIRWYDSTSPGAAVTDLRRSLDGTLWIASKSGLGRLHRGKLDTFGVSNGLPCNGIRGLVEDNRGALWLNADCGLVLIPQAELSRWSANAAAKAGVKVFDDLDGMRRMARATGYLRQAAKSRDGRLWFVALDGAAVVNPDRLPENRVPPPVKIQEIIAGRTVYPAASGLQLPPRTNELRINYTAMSFVAPEKVRFRYRLDGFDNDWKEEAASRHAIYTNLPPGSYKFRVIACNNNGLWNNAGASFDFRIQPAFYQTAAFQILCALPVGMMVWMGHRLRLRQMKRQLSVEFEAREQERTRISREMHDSLLQELCGFALGVDGLSKNPTVPQPVREYLRELRAQAQKCARETREFVWDLRAPTLQEVDLSEALRAAGERITLGESVKFHVTVQGQPRPAPEKLQQQLLRIVQEATRNAVRYSHANEIAMDIAYLDSNQIRVHMRDDGCGFDLEKAARESNHWGLRTMRERTERLGGEFRILSAPGRGTTIEVLVPIAA